MDTKQKHKVKNYTLKTNMEKEGYTYFPEWCIWVKDEELEELNYEKI